MADEAIERYECYDEGGAKVGCINEETGWMRRVSGFRDKGVPSFQTQN
jgi:hypothetical protein